MKIENNKKMENLLHIIKCKPTRPPLLYSPVLFLLDSLIFSPLANRWTFSQNPGQAWHGKNALGTSPKEKDVS